ncbi:MAG: DMT family transporter [Alphaproteobacteria bacterium]|nr:MAG: DMT family transporter [Alphaproteobacteria bacterium]
MKQTILALTPEKTKGLLYLLGACLIWAGWWVFNRYGVTNGVDPFDIVAIRLTVAGLILLPILVRRGLGTVWWKAILIACLGGLINSLASIYGVKFAPASHGATLMPGMVPIFTALLAWLILNETITVVRWLGIGLVIGGAFLIGFPNLTPGNDNQWIGHLLFIGASLSWSFYTVCVRWWRIDAWHGVALIAVVSMILYLPIYSFTFGGRIFDYPVSTILFQGLYQGILTSICAILFFNSAIAIFGASGAGAAGALIPVLTVIMAAIFLGEIPSWIEVLGIFVVIGGIPFAMGLIGSRDGKVHDDIEDKSRGTKLDTKA